MAHIVIIGNGIAGITTARHVRKMSDDAITVISGETAHFFSRTALMYIYMGHMEFRHTKPYEDWFWDKNKISLKQGWVEQVDTSQKEVVFDNGERLFYDKLVIASGSQPNRFGWPGQDLQGVTGMYSYQDLQYIEEHTKGIKQAVVVGGGLIGVELAEMLHSRNIHVTFLVREKSFWDVVLPPGESALVNKEIIDHSIDLKLSTELKEIVSDEKGCVQSVITTEGERIDCQFVGLTVGVSPRVKWLEGSGIDVNRGVLVNEYLETNVPDVYAVGDCAEFRQPLPGRRAIEQVWYTGRMQGETLAATICGQRTPYTPGIWFNSAKFFNIEYQTYGTVPAKLSEDQAQLFWKSESEKALVNIVYEKASLKVQGVNTFGIRMRHEVWNKWLSAGKSLHYVMEHLEEANFDPEFFKRYENDIRHVYNTQFPEQSIAPRKKSFLQKIFNTL